MDRGGRQSCWQCCWENGIDWEETPRFQHSGDAMCHPASSTAQHTVTDRLGAALSRAGKTSTSSPMQMPIFPKTQCQKSAERFPDISTCKTVSFPWCHHQPGLDSLPGTAGSVWCAHPYGASWVLQSLLAPTCPALQRHTPLSTDTASQPNPLAQKRGG